MLYRRGRPTSVVLLLLMVVAELSLPLGRHPSLRLHHLLRLVGAARGLVPLGGVEILQVGLVAATGVAVVVARVGSRARVGTRAAVWVRQLLAMVGNRRIGGSRYEGAFLRRPLCERLTSVRHSVHLSALDEVVHGAVDL